MKTAHALLSLVLFGCASSALAEETVGRIRALYYQAAPGVYVGAKMLHERSAERWADVEVAAEGSSTPRRVLVQLDPAMNAGIGDTVAVQIADPKSTDLAQAVPTLAQNRAYGTPSTPIFAGSASTGASTVKTK